MNKQIQQSQIPNQVVRHLTQEYALKDVTQTRFYTEESNPMVVVEINDEIELIYQWDISKPQGERSWEFVGTEKLEEIGLGS